MCSYPDRQPRFWDRIEETGANQTENRRDAKEAGSLGAGGLLRFGRRRSAGARHLVDALASSKRARLSELLGRLSRETLKESCRQLGLDDSGREKAVLVSRLIGEEQDKKSLRPSKPEQLIHPSISSNPSAQPSNGATPSVVPSFTKSSLPAATEPNAPTAQSVLQALPLPRLLDLCRVFGYGFRGPKEAKAEIIQRLAEQLNQRLPALLGELGREELRAQCRFHGLSDEGRARIELQQRLLVAAGLDPSSMASFPPPRHVDGLPEEGQIVQARHRQWLVEKVEPGEPGQSALVKLVCLDDDDPGRPLEVLWDLELGARVIDPQTQGLGSVNKLDPPSHFGAYLHALKWSAVSAADASRFQAPFRSGIKIMAHQLTPLMKALELPRANVFIADDAGLGKRPSRRAWSFKSYCSASRPTSCWWSAPRRSACSGAMRCSAVLVCISR